MKAVPSTKFSSPFAQSALSVDQNFEQLASLGKQLEEADLETEFGLNHAKRLLTHYSECGQKVGEDIQTLARELEAARIRAEEGAQKVAARALLIQKRHEEKEAILGRFQELGGMAKTLNDVVVQVSQAGREALADHVPELQGSLERLMVEAKKIKLEAHNAKMKTLEKDAESFTQMLQSVSKKLQNALGKPH